MYKETNLNCGPSCVNLLLSYSKVFIILLLIKVRSSSVMWFFVLALTVQYLCNRFLWEYDPTLEDTYIKDVVVDDKKYRVNILDTAGEVSQDFHTRSLIAV